MLSIQRAYPTHLHVLSHLDTHYSMCLGPSEFPRPSNMSNKQRQTAGCTWLRTTLRLAKVSTGAAACAAFIAALAMPLED